LETALEAEMTEHLGYECHDPVGRNGENSRNGTRVKTVLTEIGHQFLPYARALLATADATLVAASLLAANLAAEADLSPEDESAA
jgi:hypothetical protein